MKKIKYVCITFYLCFLPVTGFSQSMIKLQQKLLEFRQVKNHDSVEVYSRKILNLALIKKYPRDFNYCFYKYALAEALHNKKQFIQSNDLILEIKNEFQDSLKTYPEFNLNIIHLDLWNYYWTNNIEKFCETAIFYAKILNINEENAVSNIRYILTISETLFDVSKINEANEVLDFLKENYLKYFIKNEALYLRIQSLLISIQIKKGSFSDALKTCNEIINDEKIPANSKQIFELSKVTALIGLDKLNQALELNSKIQSNLEKNNNAKNIDSLAFNYIQHASILNHLGKFEEAQYYYKKGITIFKEKSLNADKGNLAWALAHYAGYFQEIGLYSKSLEINFESLDKRKENQKNSIYQIINLYVSIAENYKSLGDINNSIEYCTKALELCNQYYDSTYPIFYSTLSNLAVYESERGNYKSALELNLRTLKIKEKTLGMHSVDYALSLNNLSVLYGTIKDYEKALEYSANAAQIRGEILGENHPAFALSLSNLAFNYGKLGNFDKSREFNLKALKIYENAALKNSSSYFICSDNLSFNYHSTSMFDSAYFYSLNNYKNNLDNFKQNNIGLDQRLSLDAKYRLDHTSRLTFNFFNQSKTKTNSLYSNYINTNGLLSNYSKILRNKIYSNGTVEEISSFQELNTLKKRLIELQEDANHSNEKQNLEIKNQINTIEKRLSKKYSFLEKNISINDLTKSLNKEEIFIDVVSFWKYNFSNDFWTDSTQYLVFISDSKDTLVDYVFIEDGTKIDQDLFDQYKQEATDPKNKTDLKSERFYNYFWKPIADKIGDAKTIYVSLGGVYNNINLNTIYNPTTGKYLIEEKDIRIVNSARDFVLNKEREKKKYTTNTASLFGFPNFDGNTTVSADSSDLFASTRDLNSFWLDSLTRGGMKAKPLPATKIEVENISSTFKSKGWQVNSFLADNASETNIKKQQSPRILHVATHGYFFQDIPMDKDNNRFLGMDRQQVVQDPMLRSGLLLTGANKTLKGETSSGENGLLSAAEASLLDLGETELVVLSACETGKGEVKNSEGVYGLRKAFSDAGAQNIIMSLWKVDDKVTQEFMSRFYEIWLNDKMSIREAFNKTQLEIKAKYPQPYYWGAFILVGE